MQVKEFEKIKISHFGECFFHDGALVFTGTLLLETSNWIAGTCWFKPREVMNSAHSFCTVCFNDCQIKDNCLCCLPMTCRNLTTFIFRCKKREQFSLPFVSIISPLASSPNKNIVSKNQVCKNVTVNNTEIRVRLPSIRLPEENLIRPSTAG